MDIGLLIVILIAVYVIPEIMKRIKPKKPYKYPEFPSTLPSEGQGPAGIPGELSRGIKPPPVPEMSGEGMPGDEGDPFWRMPKESVASVQAEQSAEPTWGTNGAALGVVWAEIIAPPVALRPMRRGIRRL